MEREHFSSENNAQVTSHDLNLKLNLTSEEFEERGGKEEFIKALAQVVGLDESEIGNPTFEFTPSTSTNTPESI